MTPSLNPPCWPILFASSLRASSDCQLSTCRITPDHSFSLHILTKDRPWDFCQRAGDTWAPIAYLSKQLDMVTKGWPPCIQAMAATSALIPEANKLSTCPFNSLFSTHLLRLTITSGFPLPFPFQSAGPTCLSPRPSPLILSLLSP